MFESLEDRCLLDAGPGPRVVPLYVPGGAPHQFAPLASSPVGLTPDQVRHAYGFDQISFNGVPGDGTGQAIAVVAAYDEPNIVGDLHAFDQAFGLPDPVLTRINQAGGTTLPPGQSNWSVEIALDVEWAHAIAPAARIVLVEATSDNQSDVLAAVNTAALQPGVSVVSLSFGEGEFFAERTVFDRVFKAPPGHGAITYVAASGDHGAPPLWPAVSPNIVAVGGTALTLDDSNNWAGEAAWDGSGGGLANFEVQPFYQKGVVTQSALVRAGPDVAYNASPASAVAVYDSYDYGSSPWVPLGGTSAGAAQWSALLAIANQGRSLAGLAPLDGGTETLPALYQLPAGDFHDVTSGGSAGTPNYPAGPGYDLATGLGTPIANRVVADLVSYGTADVPQPADPGFEVPRVASPPGLQIDPTGSPWTFTGNAGLASNGSSFTAANPPAPQGTQIAFLQGSGGSIRQSISFAAGNYVISLSAAHRGVAPDEIIEVRIDGQRVAMIWPFQAQYTTFMTPSFTVSSGLHTVAFVGTTEGSASSSVTALIDQVAISRAGASQVADPGFEAVRVATYQYGPGGSAWTFDPTGAGLAANGSAFTFNNPPAPEGTQVAFLQARGSVSQPGSFAAGTYVLRFSAAQRGNINVTAQTIQVRVDTDVVATITPTDTSYTSYTTAWFSVSADVHTITFAGLNPNGGDNTALIDQVSLNPAPVSLVSDPGFEVPSVADLPGAFQLAPSGSAWMFNGSAGLAGNGSTFTLNNPPAPQGVQVAFVESNGSVSQTIGFAAGTYALSFRAAQRGIGNDTSQTVQVLVDDQVVGTITPSGTSYATYSTLTFTVPAGPHSITFAGLNPDGGDNTALLDQVDLIAVPSQLTDGGFENPSLGTGSTAFQFSPTGSPWSFRGSSGIAANGSALLTPFGAAARQGTQVAFLQGNGASVSQTVNFTPGTYVIVFMVLYRIGGTEVQVSLDGSVMLTTRIATGVTGAGYDTFVTNPVGISQAGSSVITFAGADQIGSNVPAFLDAVDVVQLY